jgi:hypothetical protein
MTKKTTTAGSDGTRIETGPARDDQSGLPDRIVVAEGRYEIVASYPEGGSELFARERRKIELVGGQVSGGRIVITNKWTKVVTVLPAAATIKIYS